MSHHYHRIVTNNTFARKLMQSYVLFREEVRTENGIFRTLTAIQNIAKIMT
jgi:hypothetical protein